MMKRYLNVGCGSTFHRSWENVDMVSCSPLVRQHDLTKGLPYPDDAFDVVYASHVLEHVPYSSVIEFIQECVRVAKPGGVLRFVVPDFEELAKQYLEAVQTCTGGDGDAAARHEWMIIEIIDQAVRSKSGGRMKEFIIEHRREPVMEYVLRRVGQAASSIMNETKKSGSFVRSPRSIRQFYRFAAERSVQMFAFLLCGRRGHSAVKDGFLRASGEIHHWIYDRISMRRLLERHGCIEVKQMDAFTSRIPEFTSYQLDTLGKEIRKPDSLFMEGIKA